MTPNKREKLVFAHRANIEKYRRLLKTHLTDIEREFIERRLGEEKALLEVVQRATLFDCRDAAWIKPSMQHV
jgi:hypothetical protein